MAGTDIGVGLAGQQYAAIAALMALHADVFGESRGELRRVDDGTATFWIVDVRLPRSMTIFATDGEFLERWIQVLAGPIRNRLSPAAVTEYAFLWNGAGERVIGEFVAGRQVPSSLLLNKTIAAPEKGGCRA